MTVRVFIAVTHLLGAGHLTRAAAIARAFARAGHHITLVSGGLPSALVSTAGVNVVQLPAVRIQGTDFTTLLDEHGAPVDPDHLAERRRMLLQALAAAQPDVVVTELFPFGRRVLADEFMELIEAACALPRRPLIAASIRDILAAPSKPKRVRETHERLARFYDAVLVHGDPRLASLDLSWPVDEELKGILHYTGYVDEARGLEEGAAQTPGEIVVSGGSSAASLPLLRAAVEAARLVLARPWRLLVGTSIPEAELAELRSRADAHVTVERARPDFRRLLAGAALSISQAGYNTVIDLLCTGVRAVLVPFEAGRETEQRLRAECLARHGLAYLLPESELSPEALVGRVREALSQPAAPRPDIALAGAIETVAVVERLAARRPSRQNGPVAVLDWSSLDDALAAAADAGRTIAFWWRDDDAVAHTPALDRLLHVTRSARVPIALAAIPSAIESSLAARIGENDEATLLVHGLSHRNHAPADQKKAEFGPHRPLDALVADARAALRLARLRAGHALLPVFVPPWNRVAPALVEVLPALGYVGLSAAGNGRPPETRPGIARFDTHVDPIDWRGARSLLEPGALVAHIAGMVRARLNGADPGEPIGLLTHHLIHDEAVWRFCAALIDRVSMHHSVRFMSPRLLFGQDCTSAIEP